MSPKLRHTDVVEQAAQAIYEALERSLREHAEAVRAIREDPKEERD